MTPQHADDAPADGDEFDVDVIHHDQGVLVLNKPAGLAMHGGVGVHEDDSLFGAIRAGFDVEPGFLGPSFLGRLDRPTSGLVVACLSRHALACTLPAWTRGDVVKEYLLVVHGAPKAQGTIDIALAARRPRDKGTGKIEPAQTAFRVVQSAGSCSLVVARLLTGRTHQIRRHFKAIGHPLLWDTRYGDKRRDPTPAGELPLHAWRLAHSDPDALLPRELAAAPPATFRQMCAGLGLGSGLDRLLSSPER